jgi:hypothetical protein
MKRISRIASGSALLLALAAAAVRADVVVTGVDWVVQPGGRGTAYQPAKEWKQAPASTLALKPRVVVTLENKGNTTEEAIVFSYAVSAKLVDIHTPDAEGVWTVPFLTEDHRIPWLRAGKNLDVRVDSLLLATYLRKVYRAGFWPKAIRIQVMPEARPGDAIQPPVEKELAVEWAAEKK